MSYHDAILDALQREALHREQGEDEIVLLPKEHESVPGSVPIRYLAAGPRVKSLERRRYPQKFPQLDWRNSAGTVLKINDGNMTEAFVQKALIRAGLATPESVEVSVQIDTRGIKLHGRLDAETHYTPEGEILEIKRSEKFFGKAPTPFMKYIFQVMSYGIARGIRQTYILMVEHGGIHLYRMQRQGVGWIVVNDQTEEVLKAPWNLPEFLNPTTLAAMARTMMAYLEMSDADLLSTQPIPDPLNLPETYLAGEPWQCARVAKPKSKKLGGVCSPSCAYSCHHSSISPFGIHYEETKLVATGEPVETSFDPTDLEAIFEGL